MKLLAKAVFGETVLLGEDIIVGSAHDAGDRRILREPFALHQQFQRAVAAPAGRYLIPAGFLAVGTHQRPDVEPLARTRVGYVTCGSVRFVLVVRRTITTQ